jgi:hypothetical protein
VLPSERRQAVLRPLATRGELSLTGGMAEDASATMNRDPAFPGVAGIRVTPGP